MKEYSILNNMFDFDMHKRSLETCSARDPKKTSRTRLSHHRDASVYQIRWKTVSAIGLKGFVRLHNSLETKRFFFFFPFFCLYMGQTYMDLSDCPTLLAHTNWILCFVMVWIVTHLLGVGFLYLFKGLRCV